MTTDNRITETIDSHETILIHGEMLADTLGLDFAEYGDSPDWLEIFSDSDDETYQDGKVTRLRIIAWGGDPEAGSKLIGMTGNQVTAYEIIISAGTPVELAGEILSSTIAELA
jgi:hypothetical protein